LRTAAIATMSFSDLLLLGTFRPQTNERVLIITDADQLIHDYAVPSSSPLYKAAQVAFSQIPTVPQIYIGQKDPAGMPAKAMYLISVTPHYMEVGSGIPDDPATPDVIITVNGGGFTPNSKIRFANVVEETTGYLSDTQLTLEVDRWRFSGVDPSIPVTVVDPDLGESNSVSFAVVALGSPDPGVPLPPPTPPPGVPADIMAAIRAENNDWYAFCDTDRVEMDTIGYAQWGESAQKLFMTVLTDPNNMTPAATDTTSIGAQLKNGNFFRTAWWWNPDPLEFTDVAITCRSFTKYPGGETWANQRLNAVKVTRLSETNSRNIAGKNGNTFEPFRNINITQYGKVSGGEWIDVIRFRDWLCEEIRIRVFQQMIDNRIPYTDPGIAMIRTRIAQALDLGVMRGGIAPPEVDADDKVIPSYTISMPLAASVSPNNKANRLLQDCYFTARLAGAIHVVEIKGVLTYENIMVGA
jgi:hypothetical protein